MSPRRRWGTVALSAAVGLGAAVDLGAVVWLGVPGRIVSAWADHRATSSLRGDWLVTSVARSGPGGTPALPAAYVGKLRLSFDGHHLTGDDGCNDIDADVHVSGHGHDLEVGPVRTTLVLCPGSPPQTDALDRVRHLGGVGEARELLAADGSVLVGLRRYPVTSR